MFTEPRNATAAPAADIAATPVDLTAPAALPVDLKQGEPAGGTPRILEDVLIEEVSIDGMCGVY